MMTNEVRKEDVGKLIQAYIKEGGEGSLSINFFSSGLDISAKNEDFESDAQYQYAKENDWMTQEFLDKYQD